MTLRGEKPQQKGYPTEPQTIEEHLKKKRMDLSLLQREVAAGTGVDLTTYRNEIGICFSGSESIGGEIVNRGCDERW